eukprot:8997087-Lingulodinium_polyedra.AAC.1
MIQKGSPEDKHRTLGHKSNAAAKRNRTLGGARGIERACAHECTESNERAPATECTHAIAHA